MIHLLDSDTIDKIAAGEVIERPAAVVKELVENSIDAGANAITVEIKKGGISFIRITDNGMGIEKEDIPIAFERHATSKIKDINDLLSITSLGFRGEALSSIASVSQVELITKAKHSMVGNRYEIHGGKKISFTEVGAPDGTTFIVRNIFYNTPARLKFLKSERTESTRIGEVMMHFALSHPDIRFNFIVDGKNKLNTSGNGNVKNNIFSQYGSEIAKALLPIDTTMYDMRLSGYIGKPEINRNTRSLINTYINGRIVKSPLLFKAIESGFSGYIMGGRFPFATLFLEIESSLLDVNVHPTKMEVRFMNQEEVYDLFANSIKEALKKATVIPEVTLAAPKEPEVTLASPREPEVTLVSPREPEIPVPVAAANPDIEEISYKAPEPFEEKRIEEAKKLDTKKMQQTMLELINNKEERNIFKEETEESFRLIGQVFGTYWMIEYNDEMLIIDQHAAHEKVLYEKIIKDLKDKKIYHQQLLKPVVITLTAREKQLIDEYRDAFYDLGFEIEDFGGDDIAITTVSYHFIKLDTKELFYAILDGLLNDTLSSKIELITDRCATIACKAAVKGNNVLSFREAEELIREMLRADEPYHCPHGRPTTISMSKYEFEKKFKRIV